MSRAPSPPSFLMESRRLCARPGDGLVEQMADRVLGRLAGGIALLRRSPFLLYANLSGSLSGPYLQNEQSSLASSSRPHTHDPHSVI